MKKIIFLHPAHWEQAMGGAELQISYLVKYFASIGAQVHYIYEDKGRSIKSNKAITLHPLKKIRVRKVLGERWIFYRMGIYKLLKEINPDIVYTRFYSSWSGFAALYAKKHNKIHIWAIASDNDVRKRTLNDLILKPFNILESIYVNYSYKHATYILTQNAFQHDEIKHIHKRESIPVSKVCKIHIDINHEKSSELIKIIWIANLKPLKRPDIYIEIARSLKTHQNCEFIMVGRMGETYSTLIRNALNTLDNFKYLGEITINEVHKLLSESHILINTSEYEALPNTFIEAWLNKVVVLSMNVNPDKIITEQEIGFICPSSEMLKDRLSYLVKNKSILNKMAEKSFRYVKENHSFEDYLLKIRDLTGI